MIQHLPTDATARKAIPLWSGLFIYFPDALVEVAKLSHTGNAQHNPGQPLHWAREKSKDHEDTLLRHLLDSGHMDTDGVRHSTKVAWRALAKLQLELENSHVSNENKCVQHEATGESYSVGRAIQFEGLYSSGQASSTGYHTQLNLFTDGEECGGASERQRPDDQMQTIRYFNGGCTSIGYKSNERS
jgi:Domain of unknown function (DUF5664)